MVVQQITQEEVVSLSRRALALPGEAGIHDEAFLAALVRRAAGILCPCSERTIFRAVLESLNRLARDVAQLETDVETAVEKAMIAGDLLEFGQATTGDPSAKGTWVFAAPPSFVARPSGSVFIMGIAPDEPSPLPPSLNARIVYERHFRLIQQEPSENLPQMLRDLGMLELSEQSWLKLPKEETAKNFLDRLERELMAQPVSGSVPDLLILDGARDPSYYKGRWTAPRRETGCFIARRPQVYGAPLWDSRISPMAFWISSSIFRFGATDGAEAILHGTYSSRSIAAAARRRDTGAGTQPTADAWISFRPCRCGPRDASPLSDDRPNGSAVCSPIDFPSAKSLLKKSSWGGAYGSCRLNPRTREAKWRKPYKKPSRSFTARCGTISRRPITSVRPP
jgi:hypothetical protein